MKMVKVGSGYIIILQKLFIVSYYIFVKEYFLSDLALLK